MGLVAPAAAQDVGEVDHRLGLVVEEVRALREVDGAAREHLRLGDLSALGEVRARTPRHSAWVIRSSSAASSALMAASRSASSGRPWASSVWPRNAAVVASSARSPISSSVAYPRRRLASAAAASPASSSTIAA